jgi:hypothetical protein
VRRRFGIEEGLYDTTNHGKLNHANIPEVFVSSLTIKILIIGPYDFETMQLYLGILK